VQERPDLTDAVLAAHLRQAWGVKVDAVAFLPVGEDDAAWAFDVRGHAGERYFLKVRRGPVKPAAVLVPRHLRERGLREVVAAVPTTGGAPWHEADGYALLLYPFVEGGTGAACGMSDAQWIAYGAFVRALHRVELPGELAALVPEETYRPAWTATARSLADLVRRPDHPDPWQRELAGCWQAHAGEIASLVRRTEELAPVAAGYGLPHVLCHADAHTHNVLVGDADAITMVDWDDAIRAPRERDLSFVLSGGLGVVPVTERQEALFRQGYGEPEIAWPVLAYYRYDWAVQDVAGYAARVFDGDLGEETRAHAVAVFRGLFEPGDEVEIALASERHLGPRDRK
jgi:spectinomycin phosphotransferase